MVVQCEVSSVLVRQVRLCLDRCGGAVWGGSWQVSLGKVSLGTLCPGYVR